MGSEWIGVSDDHECQVEGGDNGGGSGGRDRDVVIETLAVAVEYGRVTMKILNEEGV